LNNKFAVLSSLLAILLISGLSLASDANNNTGTATNASETAKAVSEVSKMKGIWSISGVEQEQITVALEDDGSYLFGQGKFEPEGGSAWNAEVIGTISGDNVTIVVSALKGKSQVSTWMNGALSSDTFSGKFVSVCGGKISNRGDFSATLVNPEISEYTPAKISEPAPTVTQSKSEENTQTAKTSTTITKSDTTTSDQTTTQPVTSLGRRKPVNVLEYKDKIGPGGDLSGVPPGMGGGSM
jgi:hypothetical protein